MSTKLARSLLQKEMFIIREKLISMLINPYTGNKLELQDNHLVDPVTAESFSIRKGIPVIFRDEKITGLNRLYQKRYNWLAYIYDLLALLFRPFYGVNEVYKSIAGSMEIKNDDRVLETSIGTGIQIKNLVNHGKKANFTGLDISFGMLSKCQRNSRKWDIALDLIQGNAETLPFKDEIFDVVFHIGGINFFNDKGKAILEMIRVAKPGAKIYIGDETKKLLDEQPSIASRYYQKPDSDIYSPPVKYIPKNMLAVENKELWDGKMYLISFQKPE